MTTDEKLALWSYTELEPIGKKSTLVRNNFDGRKMVLCYADEKSFPIYRRLSESGHPNLMRVFDVIISEGRCMSLCEFIEGKTLEQLVGEDGVVSELMARDIVAQLCDGLAQLHGFGIIHRDITPSNVMLDSGGAVKIIDYDIMRSVKTGQTTDTRVLGTPGFAAPEQFGFSQTDARADLYSCGVLLNYLLTGAIPSERRYHGSLSPIIARCTEMDAQNRFSSAAQLKEALLGRAYKNPPKKPKPYINYRRLPGFRSRRVLPKIITVVFLAAYFVTLAAYINFTVNGNPYLKLRHFLTGLDLLVLLTAVPYVCIGDLGGLSRCIFRRKPGLGRKLLRAVGFLSLAAGVVLFCIVPSVHN